MRTFVLSCVVGVSASTRVEADTIDQAIDIAKLRPVVLAGRGGEDCTSEWIVEDADGEPQDIHE